MRKITKKSLDELAKIMPPLSVEEQRSYIGGGWYTVDQSGNFTEVMSIAQLQTIPLIGGILAMMFSTIDFVGSSDGSAAGIAPVGTITGSTSTPDGHGNIMTVYNGQISLDFFKFLANNTNVEWTLMQLETGNAVLSTTHEEEGCSNPNIVSGVCTVYHNHSDKQGNDQASTKDKLPGNMTPGAKHFVYVEGTGLMVAY